MRHLIIKTLILGMALFISGSWLAKPAFALGPCQVQCTRYFPLTDTCGSYSGTTDCGSGCDGGCDAGDTCDQCGSTEPPPPGGGGGGGGGDGGPGYVSPGRVWGRIWYTDGANNYLTRFQGYPFGTAICDQAQPYLGLVTIAGVGDFRNNVCNEGGPYYMGEATGNLTITLPSVAGETISWVCSVGNDATCTDGPSGPGTTTHVYVANGGNVHVHFYVRSPKCTISGPAAVCATTNMSAPLPSYLYSATDLGGAGTSTLGIYGSPNYTNSWNTLVHRAGVPGSAVYQGPLAGALNQPAQFDSPGGYYVVCNAFGPNNAQGTGNPFSVGPPWNNYTYTDAGPTSRMAVTAYSALGGPTTVTVGQNASYPADGNGPIRVTWTAVAGATGYNVYRCNPTCSAAPTASNVAGTTWADPDTTLTCGVNYTYKVTPILATNPLACREASGQTGMGMCTVTEAWFSAGGGDVVAAGGGIQVTMPSTTDKFINPAPNGSTGIAIGNGMTGITASNVSAKSWIANIPSPMTNFLAKEENKFTYMKERLLSKVSSPYSYNAAQSISANIDQAMAAGKSTGGIAVMQTGGSISTLAAPENLGGRKGILIVNGDVTLRGTINLDNNSGFLMVMASGNMAVDPSVGAPSAADIRLAAYTPHLEGIFFTQGTFSTGHIPGGGASDRQLRVDGAVAAMTNVALQRNFIGLYPAEYFQYRPDLIKYLTVLDLRMKVVQELDNP